MPGRKRLSRRSGRPSERPRRGSPDGGGARASEGRRPRLRSLSQPLRPVPGSRSGQNGLPSPPQRGSAGTLPRAGERALRRGSAAGWDTASARSTDPALRTRARAAKEVSRAGEPLLHNPRKPSRPGQSHLFPRALSRRRARCLRRTQGRTTRPSLAPSPLRPASAHARARACRARGGGAREGEAAGALPAAF